MDKSIYMTAMNKVRDDCEQCPYKLEKIRCPSEVIAGKVGHLPTCTRWMYLFLLHGGKRDWKNMKRAMKRKNRRRSYVRRTGR